MFLIENKKVTSLATREAQVFDIKYTKALAKIDYTYSYSFDFIAPTLEIVFVSGMRKEIRYIVRAPFIKNECVQSEIFSKDILAVLRLFCGCSEVYLKKNFCEINNYLAAVPSNIISGFFDDEFVTISEDKITSEKAKQFYETLKSKKLPASDVIMVIDDDDLVLEFYDIIKKSKEK